VIQAVEEVRLKIRYPGGIGGEASMLRRWAREEGRGIRAHVWLERNREEA
jgi:hypothetical protein